MKTLLITPGEPAGIGPDVLIKAIQTSWPCRIIALADPDLLQQRAQLLGLPLTLRVAELSPAAHAIPTQPGVLEIFPVKLSAPVIPGHLNPQQAAYVMRTLTLAVQACLQHQNYALVTGPVHKAVMNEAGIAFSGHTEFLAQQCQVERTVMLFVVDQLKVALATTHLPLKAVSDALTIPSLNQTLTILNQGLKHYFKLATPRLFICGLNPHAGEGGVFRPRRN